MKKLTLLLFIVCPMLSIAQDKYETFEMTYFEKKYDISLGKPKDESFTYYIDCESADKLSKQANLLVKNKEIPDFVSYISALRSTYEKWSTTAKENKVTELSKDVEGKCPLISAAFSYGKWNFDFSVKLSARFKIVKEKYLMIVESGELQSSSNQFTKSDGLYIIFSSLTEFDDFIKKIDLTKATDFVKSKASKEDLFN